LHGLNIVGLKRRGFAADTIREMMSAYKDMFVTPGESINFTDNLQLVRSRYAGQQHIEEIIDFIEAESRNPICTTVPSDEP
ncbi:MAG: hypothetical protein LBJ69_04050, partial [Holosporales bacterium]|nr:hypothetical protein [Holosporales bacterium]MDR1333545.1 hypothetical protein [Holosporales bacterium]